MLWHSKIDRGKITYLLGIYDVHDNASLSEGKVTVGVSISGQHKP